MHTDNDETGVICLHENFQKESAQRRIGTPYAQATLIAQLLSIRNNDPQWRINRRNDPQLSCAVYLQQKNPFPLAQKTGFIFDNRI